MEFKKMQGDVAKAREYERMLADNNQLRADLLYVAMMADVELDEEEAIRITTIGEALEYMNTLFEE